MKASEFKRDVNGVPKLSREFLEIKAEEVIEFVDPSVLRHPLSIPVREIAKRLADAFDIPFLLNQDLGMSRSGRKILGRFYISTRTVAIDMSLEVDSPRWRFTLAHEIGHLVLHRSMRLARSGVVTREGEITDTDAEIEKPIVQPQKAKDWIEWQANKFASSLLMPRVTIRQAALDAMRQVGIDRLSHRVYVDLQRCNIVAYEQLLRTVAKIFLCSNQATEVRLKELDLVYDDRLKNMRHVTDLFRETEI
jgi:Zn-dependent peptidase ImmA (M78 family)